MRHAIRDIPNLSLTFFFEMIDFPLPLVRPSINTEPDKVIQAEKAFCITQTRKKARQEAKNERLHMKGLLYCNAVEAMVGRE